MSSSQVWSGRFGFMSLGSLTVLRSDDVHFTPRRSWLFAQCCDMIQYRSLTWTEKMIGQLNLAHIPITKNKKM